MSSWGLRASILIALQARRGEWCSPAWLAVQVIAREPAVLELCREMHADGELQMAELAGSGEPVFGLDIVGDDARINDAPEGTPA